MVPGASPGPPRGLPGASPVPPRGLPEASLGPPGAMLEDMQRNAKKQEKQTGSPDPIFQKKREIYRPRLDPEIVPERPRERKRNGKRYFL